MKSVPLPPNDKLEAISTPLIGLALSSPPEELPLREPRSESRVPSLRLQKMIHLHLDIKASDYENSYQMKLSAESEGASTQICGNLLEKVVLAICATIGSAKTLDSEGLVCRVYALIRKHGTGRFARSMATAEETNEAKGQSEERAEDRETSRCNSVQKEERMAPWEQHAAVISLPRYDYAAPSSLLHRSRSGFLITCPIKREKSATKEAMSLLGESARTSSISAFKGYLSMKPHLTVQQGYLTVFASSKGTCSTETCAKKRKLSAEVDPETAEATARNSLDNILKPFDDVLAQSLNLSLVKLTRSGLLLLTFPNNTSRHVIDIVSDIFCALASRKLKSPLKQGFTQGQTDPTLFLKLSIERKIVALIVYVDDIILMGNNVIEMERLKKSLAVEFEIKDLGALRYFLVGYNRRGMDDEIKSQKITDKDTEEASTLLDRDACFKAVAGAIKAVAKNAIVDLKSPEVAVLVELLPISGIPQGLFVAGVSVLPLQFVTIKPRLCIKSLIADAKAIAYGLSKSMSATECNARVHGCMPLFAENSSRSLVCVTRGRKEYGGRDASSMRHIHVRCSHVGYRTGGNVCCSLLAT
ncbi:hypothetical protein ZIOFF_008205 [Zingiber officinale]|uniref:Reverse transcriptase Ty1/copia-type domain-containing protein n=1 Tax=Zingiber officinale TaxID=94328 RepID=A0A8J5IHU8_ZINOF|nr:hypothetical protein ZIOFF_008205 [Zingiber officinale]